MNTTMSDYRALIVDFGGVLTTPLQEAFAEFAHSIGVELPELVRIMLKAYAGEEDSLIVDFETGRMDEDEFSVEFASRVSELAGHDVEPAGIVGRLFKGMDIEGEMIEFVERVKGSGFKTGLLSNSWGTSTYPRDLIDPLFDSIVISGEVGLRKPDPEIFRMAAKQLECDPEQCIFVDDHSGHLTSATELGMRTVLHRSPKETIAEVEELLQISGGRSPS